MINFGKLYGKWCITILMTSLLVMGAVALLRKEWRSYGIVADGGKAAFTQNSAWGEEPVIDARSCRLAQGEPVKLTELISARDGDGSDLTEALHFQDRSGNELSGNLDTGTPGEYPVTITVKSPRTGKEGRKKILILVDGRVSE